MELFCPILMKMIPEEITLECTQKMDESSVLNVKELMDYVKREVESRERTADLILKRESASPVTPTQYRDHAWEQRSEGRHSQNTAASASELHAANSEEINCIFCNRNHSINNPKPDHSSRFKLR